VSSEEKRDETVVWLTPLLVLAANVFLRGTKRKIKGWKIASPTQDLLRTKNGEAISH